jgi:hypothetical protein
MPAEARVTKMWTQQKGLIPFLFILFGAYFLYDGFVGYPRSDERWKAHEERKGTPGAWEAYAAERGWKTQPPEKFLGPEKYREQYYFGTGTLIVGILSLVYWQRQRRVVIRNDATGISTSRGLAIPYASITRVDKKIWKEKGFAYIEYQQGGGTGKFTLDDAKFDPKALDIILEETVAAVKGRAVIEDPNPPAAPEPPPNPAH